VKSADDKETAETIMSKSLHACTVIASLAGVLAALPTTNPHDRCAGTPFSKMSVCAAVAIGGGQRASVLD